MLETTTTLATPNPGPSAVTGATGVSVLLGWGAAVLGAKLHIPTEVLVAGLTGLATLATTAWHHFFGPAVPVTVPKAP